jgi:hypothetical protein
MFTPLSPSAPRVGDVVVVRDGLVGRAYLLRVLGDVTQLRFQTCEDAVRDAITYAEIHRVDAWYTADGKAYTRTFRCRPPYRAHLSG